MTSNKKSFRGKSRRHADLLESEKLRQDVEELENALILHSRYQSEFDSSVRGLIRKEIEGSRWEYGGDGKLTTYRSKHDLVHQRSSPLEHEEIKRSRSLSRQLKKEKLKADSTQHGIQCSNAENQLFFKSEKVSNNMEKSKIKKTGDKSPRRRQNNRKEHDSADTEPSSLNITDPNASRPVAEMKTLITAHKLDSKKLIDSKKKQILPNDSLVIAAQSMRKFNSDAGGKNPVASYEMSYSFNSPGRTLNKEQPADTYLKTLEFLMSQLNAAQLSSPPPREKAKRHRSSELPKGDHLEAKHHSRRHTVDGQHLSSKWAETTQGVSYLDSRMWRSVVKDSIPDECIAQDFEEPRKHSAPSSCKSDRSSLSVEVMENTRNEFKINLPGQYYGTSNNMGKGGSSGRNQDLTPRIPEAWLAPATLSPEQEGVGCSISDGCNILPNLSNPQSHTVPSTNSTAITTAPQTPDSISADSREDALEKHLHTNLNKSECDPDVKKWLLGLDLQSVDHYIQLFSEHQMDITSVRLLTTSALREMGINALGPIMKIMKGVQVLCRHEILAQDQVQVDNMSESAPENGKLDTSEIINAASLHTPRKENMAESSKANISEQALFEKISQSGTEEMLKNNQTETAKQETKEKLSGSLGIQSSADKVYKNPATRKTSAEKGKKSRNKVTGKPPVASKFGDDGIASAAKKFAVKHQEQIRKQELEEKSASLRKQMRDEMADKHLLRRSSSLERKTGETGGLIRSSSFTCMESASHEPVQKLFAKENINHMKKKGQEKVCLENFTEQTDTRSECDRWSSADIRALKKQLNDLEVNLAHQEEQFKLRTSQTCPVGHFPGPTSAALMPHHDKTGLDDHGMRRQQLSLEATEQGLKEEIDTATYFPQTFLGASKDLEVKFYPGSMEEVVNGEIKKPSSSKKPIPQNKEIEKNHDLLKDKSASATSTMVVPGHSFAFKRNSEYRDLMSGLKSQTKTRPDFSVTGFHIEDLKKVKLDKNDIYFTEKDIVGDGTYSQVFRGSYHDKVIAVKRLKFPLQPTDKNYFAAEVSMLQKLHHPNVVTLLGVCSIRKLPHIVLEYVSGGSLRSFLHDDTRVDFGSGEFYQIATDISSGIHYLHSQQPPVLHLDLNSRNVLLGQDLHAKIADFGFSKLKHEVDTVLPKMSKSRQVSGGLPSWMAPELINAGEVTAKADVYSFAIVLWEMLTRKLPYEGCSVYQVLEQVRHNRRPVIPDHCPPNLSRLVQKCWDQNPAARPGFKDIIKNLESLSASQNWRGPDQLLSPSVREDLAASSSVSDQEVNVIPAVQSVKQVGDEESRTSLELKTMSSESDSDSLILCEDITKPQHSTTPKHIKNDVSSSSGQKKWSSQVFTNQGMFAHNSIAVSNSLPRGVSSSVSQKQTRNSFPLPGQVVTGQSTDYLKSSHSARDRLLPLRHSMDKPNTSTMIPVSTKEKISRATDDEALSGLINKYSNIEKNQSSTEVSSKNLLSTAFNQKSKTDTVPSISLESSESMSNDLSSVKNSLPVDVFKNDVSKSTSTDIRLLSHSSEEQSYVPLFYDEAHFTQSKSHRGKIPFGKGNQNNVTPLSDTCDKVDIKFPTESAVSPVSTKAKMSGDIQTTVRTVESPRINKPESQSQFETKVSVTSERTLNTASVSQNASVDYNSCNVAQLIAVKTNASLHENVQFNVISSVSTLTESSSAVRVVNSCDMIEQKNNTGSFLVKSSVTKQTSLYDDAQPSLNTVTDQYRKLSPTNVNKSPCVSDNRPSIDINGSDTKMLPFVKSSLGSPTDSEDSSDLDTISVDSLSLEPQDQLVEKRTSPAAGCSLLKSHQEIPSPKREVSIRTSSPKPYPTKSSKYSPVKVASVSPSRTHENQLASSVHSSREKFCLFDQQKEFQPFQFGEVKVQINEHDKILVPTSQTLTKSKIAQSPVNSSAVNGIHIEKYSLRTPAAPVIRIPNSAASLDHEHSQKRSNSSESHKYSVSASSSVPPAPILDFKMPSSHGHLKSTAGAKEHSSTTSSKQNSHFLQDLKSTGSKEHSSTTSSQQHSHFLQGHLKSTGSKEHSSSSSSQQHSHLLQGNRAAQQPSLQCKKTTTEYVEPVKEPLGRFSLEASMLKMQRGQLRSVTTREPPPLNSVIREAEGSPVFSVTNILKKALIDRRFAMGVNHDSADVTPDASWSFQDEEL